MAQRLALFIGVGEYANAAYDGRQPACCCTDAHAFAELIRENKPRTPNPNFRLLSGQVFATPDPYAPTDPAMNAAALTKRVHDLFTLVRKGDALLYFTGHAVIVDDDLLLLTPDDHPDDPDDRNGISIRDVQEMAARSQANSITIILDCCHSGFAATLEWPRNVTILASTDEYTDAQALFGTHLLYTSSLMAALDGSAADVQGVVTPLSLHSAVSSLLNLGEDGQQPVLRTWSDTNSVLRQVDAGRTITQEELARIVPSRAAIPPRRMRGDRRRRFHDAPPTFNGFPSADSSIAVYPEHESPDARDGVMRTGRETWDDLDDLQRDMELFKHLRNAKLLQAFIREADGSEHSSDLFWACLAQWDVERQCPTGAQGYVRLTDLGKLYWQIQHKR